MDYLMIARDNDFKNVLERYYTLKCPHCHVVTSISVVSIPQYELVAKYRPQKVGMVYLCNACKEPIFLRFEIQHNFNHGYFLIEPEYEQVERPLEEFDYGYLPNEVADDFREALLCFSCGAYNGFAAMCRRTVQSISANLGAGGGDRVTKQLEEARSISGIDDDTYSALSQVVVGGHDGAHPHLPSLNPERAQILLELMKDVLRQLYVRKQLISQSIALRKESIEARKKQDAG